MKQQGYGASVLPMYYQDDGRETAEDGLGTVLGRDCAGEVEEVGGMVWDCAVGEQVVFASSPLHCDRLGCWADYVDVPVVDVVRKPKEASWVDAAAVPFAGLTAWSALFDFAQVRKGQRVLLHGAAGGVGHIAVQVLKALNCTVLASCRADQREFVTGTLGADEAFDYTQLDEMYGAVGERSCDVVLDLSDNRQPLHKCLAGIRPEGHYVSLNGSFIRDADESAVPARGLAAAVGSLASVKRQAWTEHQVHHHWALYKHNPDALRTLLDMVSDGRLRVHVGAQPALDEAGEYVEDVLHGRAQLQGKAVFGVSV